MIPRTAHRHDLSIANLRRNEKTPWIALRSSSFDDRRSSLLPQCREDFSCAKHSCDVYRVYCRIAQRNICRLAILQRIRAHFCLLRRRIERERETFRLLSRTPKTSLLSIKYFFIIMGSAPWQHFENYTHAWNEIYVINEQNFWNVNLNDVQILFLTVSRELSKIKIRRYAILPATATWIEFY